MGVLDEWSRVAVEIDGLFRVEKHRLLRIHLDDEILESSKAYHVIEFVLVFVRHVGEFAGLL